MSQKMPTESSESKDVVDSLVKATTFWRSRTPRTEFLDGVRGRASIGVETYGTRLKTFNGRDAVQDAEEELLDAAIYLWQAKMEAEASGRAIVASETMVKAFDDVLKAYNTLRTAWRHG